MRQKISLALGKDAVAGEEELAGVLPKGWESDQLQVIENLATKLVEASPSRSHGFIDAQLVLIRANAGTGKVHFALATSIPAPL